MVATSTSTLTSSTTRPTGLTHSAWVPLHRVLRCPSPRPTPSPTPTPYTGGPHGLCFIGPAPSPSPSPNRLKQSKCPCGTHEERDKDLFLSCLMAGGNVPTVGTAAESEDTPETRMEEAARTGQSTGQPNAVPTNPNAPRNPGPAVGAALTGAAAVTSFCSRAAIRCAKD